MGHNHDHSRGGASTASSRAFAVGVSLNAAFVVIEVAFGIVGDSVALIADAAHNFSDVLGLSLAWGAARLARTPPSARRTYGLRRSTILASLANAILLLVGVGGVSWEAIGRLRDPENTANGLTMLAVAAIGVVVNGGSALLFMHGQKSDANVRGAFLHLLADAAVSVGVVFAGLIIWLTAARWVDPVVSLVVSGVILVGTWSLLRDAMNLALDAVPAEIEPDKVKAYLASLPHVVDIHDLHIWALSTTETALTGHLVVDAKVCAPGFLKEVEHTLEHRFGIHHMTIQMDPPESADECSRAAEAAL